MMYVVADQETGKIEAIHEVYFSNFQIDHSQFDIPNSIPDDFDTIMFNHYKYLNHEFIPLTEQERIDLYFNGVDPEAEREQKKKQYEQEALLNEMLRRTFFDNMTDDQAMLIPLLIELWQSNKTYKVGQRVRYGGLLYKCLEEHTSDLANAPDSSTIWSRTIGTVSQTYPSWSESNTYNINDIVSYQQENWISDTDNNTSIPGQSTMWTKL